MGRTACTEPQFLYKDALYLTVELYLYFPYEPYGLYRASVPVQGVHFSFTLPICCYLVVMLQITKREKKRDGGFLFVKNNLGKYLVQGTDGRKILKWLIHRVQ
jgi:hypothetical protein